MLPSNINHKVSCQRCRCWRFYYRTCKRYTFSTRKTNLKSRSQGTRKWMKELRKQLRYSTRKMDWSNRYSYRVINLLAKHQESLQSGHKCFLSLKSITLIRDRVRRMEIVKKVRVTKTHWLRSNRKCHPIFQFHRSLTILTACSQTPHMTLRRRRRK